MEVEVDRCENLGKDQRINLERWEWIGGEYPKRNMIENEEAYQRIMKRGKRKMGYLTIRRTKQRTLTEPDKCT